MYDYWGHAHLKWKQKNIVLFRNQKNIFLESFFSSAKPCCPVKIFWDPICVPTCADVWHLALNMVVVSVIFWTKTKTLTWGREGLSGWLGGMGPPVDMWICGYVDLWLCGFVDMWICGHGYLKHIYLKLGSASHKAEYFTVLWWWPALGCVGLFWKSKVNAPTIHQNQSKC